MREDVRAQAAAAAAASLRALAERLAAAIDPGQMTASSFKEVTLHSS